MNKSAEKAAWIEELQQRNAVENADKEARRQHRLLAGEPAVWDAPSVLRHVVKQFDQPTPAPQAADTEGALIDAVVEYVQSEVAPLRKQIAELRAEISVTKTLVASSNASWLNRLRAGRKAGS